MNVVMLLSNACVSDPRVEKEAEALALAGHSVTVLAWDRTGGAPEREERRGFVIERLGPRAGYGGGLKSLPLFRRFWALARRRAVELAPDVVHSHDTDTIVPGLAAVRDLRRRGRTARFVVDFHELYRASKMVPQKGLVGVAARAVVDRIERRAVKHADVVVVANPGTVPHYATLGAGERLVLVQNAPDADLFRPLPCAETQRPFTVTFIGRKRYARTLEALVQAIQPCADMRVVLAGSGPDAERIDAFAAHFERVEVEGHVPYAEIPARYACCDVVHAAYDAVVGNVRCCTPGKVLEAMACGKPVLVSSGTWVAGFVESNRVGIAADGTDPASVRAALVRFHDDPDETRAMGERGRAIVEAGLNWESAAHDLVEAYARLS